MAGARDMLIRFLGDSSGAKKATQEVDASTEKLGGNLKNLAGTVASAYATTQIFAFGKAAVGAASDLGESQSKVGVIFGDVADDIVAWSKTTADSMGISQQAALDAASTFATFGKSAGLAGDDLATFGMDLTGLSADLASFYNTSPEEAILAIGAALRGESEPIRKYGVLLDDATLKARAMEMGIYSGTGALSAQQKVLAAQAEIMAQTSDAQGDFDRTSDGLANKSRKLSAEFANMQAQIGTALLPVMSELTSMASGLIGWFSSLDEGTQAWIARLAILGGGLLATSKAVTGLSNIFGSFKAVLVSADGGLNKFATGLGKSLPVLAAAGVLIKGLMDRSSDLAAIQAWRTDQIQAYADAVKAGGDQVQALVDRLTAVGTVDITFDEFKGDLTGAMQEAGVSVDAFATAVIGGEEGLTRLRDAMEEAGVAGYQQELIMMGATQQQGLYNKGVDAADRFNEVYEASLDAAAGAALGLAAGTQTLTQRTSDSASATNTAKTATEQLTNRIYEGVAIAEAAAAATGKMIAAELAAEAATRAWDTAWAVLTGNLDSEQALINLAQQIDDVRAAGATAWQAQIDADAALAAGAVDAVAKQQAAEDAQRTYQSSLIGTKQSVIDIGKEIGLLPTQVQTLLDMQDNGEIEAMENRINIMARNRTMALSITAKGGSGVFTVSGIGAEGGIVTQPTRSIIGDDGPEMVIPLDRMPGASALPASLGGGGGFTFINNAPLFAKQDVARELYDLIVDGQRRGELVGSLA